MNSEENVFILVWKLGNISFLLWDKLRNIIIEKDVVIIEMMKIGNNDLIFHNIILDIIIISLIVLIEGGAEILIAININHQNVMLGDIIIIPLKEEMFREWNFIYISFVNKNSADEDNPCAIIMIIAPINPIWFIENSLIKTKAMCATEE